MKKEFKSFIWENPNKECRQDNSSMSINQELRIITMSEEERNKLDIRSDKIQNFIKK